MQKEIVLGDQLISYTLRESSRAKVVNITVDRDGSLLVSLPKRKKESEAISFLEEKKDWILFHLEKAKNDNSIYLDSHRGKKFELMKDYANIFIKRKVEEINNHYSFKINKVSVRNQKSQWGSCSAKGNLSFTYKLILLPDHLAEYVIAHEICHLKEFNHGENFWNLLEEYVPNCRKVDKELKRYHLR